MSTTTVAVSAQSNAGHGNIATSPDGVTWTERFGLPKVGGNEASWNDICYSPGLGIFCAVSGGSGVTATSPDGITWTGGTIPGRAFNRVCWSPSLGLFCAVNSDGTTATCVYTSPDGLNWTARNCPEANQWVDVCWSAGLGLFCAIAATGTHQIMTSPDGVTWTAQTHASGTSGLRWLAWDPVLAKFCYCDSTTTDSTLSSDGVTWTRFAAVFSGGSLNSLAARHGGGFIGGGHNDRVFYSATGQASWSGPVSAGGSGFGDVKRIVYSAALNIHIATFNGATQAIITTPDNGVTWTEQTLAINNPFIGIADSSVPPPPVQRSYGLVIW